MPTASIEVRGPDGLLYSGEADFSDHEGDDFDWKVSFVVPSAEVAQFQMRLGDRVAVHVAPDRRAAAFIGGFAFENDASARPFGGHGRIRLDGTGPLPLG